MRKKDSYTKRKNTTVSVSLRFSVCLDGGIEDNEFLFHLKDLGLRPSGVFLEHLVEISGLTQQEFLNRWAKEGLRIAGITIKKGLGINDGFNKKVAKKILEEHSNKKVKKRMKNYLKKKEWKITQKKK